MKDQLKIEEITLGEIDRLAKALSKYQFKKTAPGVYEKQDCRVTISDDLTLKIGKSENSGLSVRAIIIRLNKLFKTNKKR